MEPTPQDDLAPEPPRRSVIRLVMIGTYVAVGVGMLAWPSVAPLLPTQEPLAVTGANLTLCYLFGVYLCAKAVALFVKYRQDFRPPRYTDAYLRADDLFPPPPPDGPGKKTNG